MTPTSNKGTKSHQVLKRPRLYAHPPKSFNLSSLVDRQFRRKKCRKIKTSVFKSNEKFLEFLGNFSLDLITLCSHFSSEQSKCGRVNCSAYLIAAILAISSLGLSQNFSLFIELTDWLIQLAGALRSENASQGNLRLQCCSVNLQYKLQRLQYKRNITLQFFKYKLQCLQYKLII